MRKKSEVRNYHGLKVLAAALLMSCATAPTKEIADAEAALEAIKDAEDCAPETYRSAQSMLEKAKRLVEEEKFKEAQVAAQAALSLAEDADKETDEKWEDCQKRKAEEEARRARELAEGDLGAEGGEGGAGMDGVVPEGLERIYFGFDESSITMESKEILARNARWLKAHPAIKVVVEGHCDSRGSNEYNLALGQKRARSVKDYMISLGVEEDRLGALSFGEERPLTGESDYSKNRRAEFMSR